MTKRKQLRLFLLILLTFSMGAGLVGAVVTWDNTSWMRLEFWLCLLGIAAYLCRGLRLILRRREDFFLGAVLESNLVCTALYMLILEYWVFPMQSRIAGFPVPEENIFRLVGKAIPLVILLGWVLIDRQGAGRAKTLLSGGILPLGYLVFGLAVKNHPYFFFDPMTVGGTGLREWVYGWLILLPLLLLLLAAGEYVLSVLRVYSAAKKSRNRNINGRGMTK